MIAGLWVASIDLIPEFIPIIGPLDDIVVVALALRYAGRQVPRHVLLAAWPGDTRLIERLLGPARAEATTQPSGEEPPPARDTSCELTQIPVPHRTFDDGQPRVGPVTSHDIKADIAVRLRAVGCVFAEDEADVLLATTTDPATLDEMVSRRATGVPLEQVVGWADFAGVRVIVHPGVFVPRRRTEALVRAAVAVTRPGATVVDLCCGTGAIAAAIAAAVPALRLWASDVDPGPYGAPRRTLRTRCERAGRRRGPRDSTPPPRPCRRHYGKRAVRAVD